MRNERINYQFRSLGDEVYTGIKLLQLVVTSRRVGNDFDTFTGH